jgi:cytochrome c
MDSLELNKVAGAVLGTLLFAMGSGFVAELIYHPKPAGNAGYALPEPAPADSAAAPAAAKAEPIAVRLASANAEKGQAGSKACAACHSFEKGGANKVGPGLWDIVERQKAGHAGFEYSAALKEKGGTWTYADLDAFLENPKGYAKGTKMAYAGLTSPQERGNVIAYLRNLAESPKPLPVAEAKTDAAPAEAKPADAAKPADGAKPVANKPSEGKDSPAKPGDPKSPDAKPAEPKPAEATTTRNDPAPAQPSEPKTAAEPAGKPAQ